MRFFLVTIFISGSHSLSLGNYSDTCDYEQNYRCGDICLDFNIPCVCEGQVIEARYSQHYFCCAPPGVQCKETEDGAVCPQGE